MSCEALPEELAVEKEAILQEFRLRRQQLEKVGCLDPDSGVVDLQFRGVEVLVDAAFTGTATPTDVTTMNRLVDYARVLGERIAKEKEAKTPQPFFDPRVGSGVLHR